VALEKYILEPRKKLRYRELDHRFEKKDVSDTTIRLKKKKMG